MTPSSCLAPTRRSASRSPRMEGTRSPSGAASRNPAPPRRDDRRRELDDLILDAVLHNSPCATQAGETRPASPQYFTQLLASVARAAAADGPPLIDLGRGNPEVGPPPHVVERLAEVAREDRARLPAVPRASCAPRGDRRPVPDALRRRVGPRHGGRRGSRDEDGVVELAVVLAERESAVCSPTRATPTIPPTGAGRSEARPAPARPGRRLGPAWDEAPRDDVAAVYLNYPSNPCAAAARRRLRAAVGFAEETDAAIVTTSPTAI